MAKRVKSTVDYDHPVVVHRLMDGTVLDSIEGYVIPAGHPAYEILLEMCLARMDREAAEREKEQGGDTYAV